MYLLFIEVSVLVPILLSYILSTHYRSNRRFTPRAAIALSLPKSQFLILSILSYSLLLFLVSSLSLVNKSLFIYITTFIVLDYKAPGPRYTKYKIIYKKTTKAGVYRRRRGVYSGGKVKE